ncbi:Cadherin-N [Carabus blaptoides fortunei]
MVVGKLSKSTIPPSILTKFIRIGIADKNDNPPYFDKALYEAEVDENEDIQHTVLTVTAKDHDECNCYFGHPRTETPPALPVEGCVGPEARHVPRDRDSNGSS